MKVIDPPYHSQGAAKGVVIRDQQETKEYLIYKGT